MAQEWPNLTFIHLDGLLGRLRQQMPDREARFAAYRDLAVDGVIDIGRLHDFERRRLEAMDRKFGGGIGQFILDGFRRRRLFHTMVHPAGAVMTLLLRQLAAHLGAAAPGLRSPGLDQLGYLEVPVHPLVAAALGVRWAGPRTRYCSRGEWLTWEEYVRRYIAHYG
jgi:Polysaccharide biosynthesis enzyme WcbI